MGRQRNNPLSPGGMQAGEDAARAPRSDKAGRAGGRASRPVQLPCGLEIGGGAVHPEFPIRLRQGTLDAAASCAAGAAGGGHSARPFLHIALRCAKYGTAPEVMCAVGVAACAVSAQVACEAGASGPALAAMADLWHGDAVEETLAACEALRQGRPLPGAGETRGAVARVLSEDGAESLADAIQTCQKPYRRAIAAAYAVVTLLAENWGDGSLTEEGRGLLGKREEQLLLPLESGQVVLDHFRGNPSTNKPTGEMRL